MIDLTLIMRRLESVGYSETEASALYGNYTTLAVPIFNLAMSIITPISIVFIPIFAQTTAKKDRKLGARALRDALGMCAMLTAPLLIGVIVYSGEILDMLFNGLDISVGAPLLCLLIPSIAFLAPLTVINSALETDGCVRAPIFSMLTGSAAKLLVSYTLLGNDGYGIAGAPIGTVISYAVALSVSLIIACGYRKMHVPLIAPAILPYLLSFGCVMASKFIYVRMSPHIPKTPALLIAVAICAILYLTALWLSGAVSTKKLRQMTNYTKFTQKLYE